MRGMVPPDPETQVSQERYAVVYVPRRSRKRFAANCITLCDSAEDALAAADPAGKRFPAIVLGPSRSSEGQYLYYLVRWL